MIKVKLLLGSTLLLASMGGLCTDTGLLDSRKSELTHIVKQDCGSCHGMTLNGGLGTPLLPQDLEGKSTEFIKITIMHGRPGTAMPPFKAIFTEAEAQWIAAQLKKGAFK